MSIIVVPARWKRWVKGRYYWTGRQEWRKFLQEGVTILDTLWARRIVNNVPNRAYRRHLERVKR